MFVYGGAAQLFSSVASTQVSQAPQFIFWYHNERMINYDSDDKARVQVLTETTLAASDAADAVGVDQVLSLLTIRNVTDADSGNYSCVPSNAEPASTLVYVSEGNFDLISSIIASSSLLLLAHRVPGLIQSYLI